MVKYGALNFSERWEGGEIKNTTHDKKKCRKWECGKVLFDGECTHVKYDVYTYDTHNPFDSLYDAVKFDILMTCLECGDQSLEIRHACEGVAKEKTLTDCWTCSCGKCRQVISKFTNVDWYGRTGAVLDWVPLVGTAFRAAGYLGAPPGTSRAETELRHMRNNLFGDAVGIVACGVGGPLGKAAGSVAPSAANPIIKGATYATTQIGNGVMMTGGGYVTAELVAKQTTEIGARIAYQVKQNVSNRDEQNRHDFGFGTWDICYACRTPVFNRGCKACGLRFCPDCYSNHTC
jgi:hypothetical protein